MTEKVKIEFAGPNGSGKTLMMKVIAKRLAECGCLVTSFDDEHRMEIEVLERDELGEASRCK